MTVKQQTNKIIRTLLAKNAQLTFEVYSTLRKVMGAWATPWKLSEGRIYSRYVVKTGKTCAVVRPLGNGWEARVSKGGHRQVQGNLSEALVWCEQKLADEGWTVLPGGAGWEDHIIEATHRDGALL